LTPRLLLPLAALLAAYALAAPTQAARIAERTVGVDGGGRQDSQRAVISDDGSSVVFDSRNANLAPDRNGRVRDVFVRAVATGDTRLISAPPSGGANGGSFGGALSSDGFIVAFESTASNLAAGDSNRRRDVFVRPGVAPVVLISRGLDGAPANGESGEADLSASGRMLVFSSTASNLVGGDGNRVRDIFVCDLLNGVITRVSQSADGTGGNAGSRAPAISPDGRYVSFYSSADNLVRGDRNDLPDVFLADVQTGRVRRVSVSSSERAQNDAVEPPYFQVSDVSRGGRYVVFDSDATNLVRHDRRGHTDVFVRDTRRGRTARVSRARRAEANSDSVYPRITPSGRFVSFESFANNLFPTDAPGADSFLFDRTLELTTLLDVPSSGRVRRPPHGKQLLQRPSLSADGNVAAFTSFARLVADDRDRAEDTYVRRTAPAVARVRVRRGRYRITADDPRARAFLCRLGKLQGFCNPKGSVAFLPRGRYVFAVRAVGPGMRPGPLARLRFRR
jgi:Tol biopolymer transport system component